MEILLELVYIVAEYLIHVLLAFALGAGIKFINDKRLREIARDAVLFAQQVGENKGWDNEKKFEEAKEYLIDRISLTPLFNEKKSRALIESALKLAKKEFKSLW